MSQEKIAILLFIAAIILILLELMWLYTVSQQQEDLLRKNHTRINTAKNIISAVLSAPSETSQDEEIKRLVDFMNKDKENVLYITSAYLDFNNEKDKLSNERKLVLERLYQKLDPVPALRELLKHSNNYKCAYIVRCLGLLHAYDAADDIREYLDSKNATLVYNAGMALSSLGDEDGVFKYIKLCENNRKYSHRVLLELLDLYTGDKVSLIKRYIKSKDVDEYVKATVFKSVSDQKFAQLKQEFIDGFYSKNNQVRIASVKALSTLGTKDLEQYMITAARDKDWVIRLSSIKGLEQIKTPSCIDEIKMLTSDEQWWVRQRAAEALVKVDDNLARVESVINGYDRYAADAVKNVLYKQ